MYTILVLPYISIDVLIYVYIYIILKRGDHGYNLHTIQNEIFYLLKH